VRTAKLIAASLALCTGAVFAQTEIILDNVAPAFSATGTWPASTSVTGFVGANYQSHAPNGAPPGAIVVDNTDAGFSVTGAWPGSASVPGYVGTNYAVHAAKGEPPTAIVADNTSGTAVGSWPLSTAVGGHYGANYQPHAAGTGSDSFAWTLNVSSAATYEVYARWTAHPNRASNAKYTVIHAGGQDTVTLNQQANTGAWQLIGTYAFNAGPATVTLSDDANGYVIADAVMLAPPGAAPNTATWTLSVPTSGSYEVFSRWTQHPNRATNAPYTVNHASGSTTVLVNQEAGGGTWFSLGTFTFSAGSATVTLTDQANDYVIADAVMLLPPGSQPNTATWTPNVPQAGQYEVYARWTASGNRASNATYTVTHAQGTTPIAVNQQANGGVWNLLGTFNLAPGTSHKVSLTDQANGYVVADAIRLAPISLVTELKLHFVHVDHLNTPRAVYDDQQQPRWRWDQAEPFGSNTADGDPSSLGVVDLPLRFAGQYADKETFLHQNNFRDYDSLLGRYLESDPVGIRGGLNTFGYANSSPLIHVDPLGLAYVSISVGGSQFMGLGGYSVATGVAYGGGINLCFYSISCSRFGAGITVSAANFQGGFSTGTACSGQRWVTGIFGSGGAGLGGISSIRGADGQISMSAGVTVSPGPNVAGGGEVCLVMLTCPNEPACCKQPRGCQPLCPSGNLSEISAP
jgi:RHS repeat-associated protein